MEQETVNVINDSCNTGSTVHCDDSFDNSDNENKHDHEENKHECDVEDSEETEEYDTDSYDEYTEDGTMKKKNMESKQLIKRKASRMNDKTPINEEIVINFGNKLYVCPDCEKAHDRHNDLKRHMKSAHPKSTSEITDERLYGCPVCDNRYYANRDLKEHIIISHTVDKPYNCDVCYETFHLRRLLMKHKKATHGAKIYKCDICQVSFSLNGALTSHMKTHSDRKTMCNICGKMVKHIQMHINCVHYGKKKGGAVQCPYCHRMLSSSGRLNEHINGIHLNIREFRCDKCERYYTSQSQLNHHILENHSGRIKKRPKIIYEQCTECGIQVNKVSLPSHMLSHSDVKEYICSICSKQFKMKHHLGNHMTKHSDVRPYPCAHCDLRFKLAHHMRFHLDRKHPHVKDTSDS